MLLNSHSCTRLINLPLNLSVLYRTYNSKPSNWLRREDSDSSADSGPTDFDPPNLGNLCLKFKSRQNNKIETIVNKTTTDSNFLGAHKALIFA